VNGANPEVLSTSRKNINVFLDQKMPIKSQTMPIKSRIMTSERRKPVASKKKPGILSP